MKKINILLPQQLPPTSRQQHLIYKLKGLFIIEKVNIFCQHCIVQKSVGRNESIMRLEKKSHFQAINQALYYTFSPVSIHSRWSARLWLRYSLFSVQSMVVGLSCVWINEHTKLWDMPKSWLPPSHEKEMKNSNHAEQCVNASLMELMISITSIAE